MKTKQNASEPQDTFKSDMGSERVHTVPRTPEIPTEFSNSPKFSEPKTQNQKCDAMLSKYQLISVLKISAVI